jgi:hypothetical protein
MNFGADLLLMNGDLVWQGDNLATVSDVDNVHQQAYLRSITDKGESVFFKNYGSLLQQYKNLPFTEENKRKIEAEAKATLLQVGNANGRGGWIEQVIDCRAELVTVDGKQAKTIFAKYIIRGESIPRVMNFSLDGV